MSAQPLHELARQVEELMQGEVRPAVAADSAPARRAMHLVLSELRKEVPYDSCSVQELRDARLVIVGGVGFSDLDVIVGESFPLDSVDIPNGEVVHRRRPLIVADAEQYRAFRRGLHVGHGIRSWLGVPLLHEERLVGVLALDKAEAGYYTQDHAATAMAYASLMAAAMSGVSRPRPVA